MTSIITLTPDQIAQLQDQISSLTNKNAKLGQASAELTNLQVGRTIADELLGRGDNSTTAFNAAFFPVVASSVDLHTQAITGPALSDPADFSIDLATGEITLTAQGVTTLGTDELHIAYQIPGIDDVDATIRATHEAIESDAILHLEREIKFMKGPFPTAAEVVDETKIVDSVTSPYELDAASGPLYPKPPDSPFTPPASPGDPTQAPGLFGGTEDLATNEFDENAAEIADIIALRDGFG